MSRTKGWTRGFFSHADEGQASPPAAPAQVPLEDADRKRQPPPQNPTGIPDVKPAPLSDLMGAIESASKAALDAGLDIEKCSASLRKLTAMGGVTPAEREIIAKAIEFAREADKIKKSADQLASGLAAFRQSLPSGAAAGWTQ